LEAASELLKLFPSEARAHFEVGEQMANLGRYQEAQTSFKEAVRIDPTFAEAYNSLGDSQSRNGEYQAALENFRKARSLDSKNVRAVRGIGQSLVRLKQYDEALAELEKSVQDVPDDAQLYFLLSQVYTRVGSREKAAQAVEIFEKLRAKEVEKEDSERKRKFEPGAGTVSQKVR
jgi:tetratricopeptide (TPR) repeat protein